MIFQKLVSDAEAKAHNLGYNVAKLPVMTPSGKLISTVEVRTIIPDGHNKPVWALVLVPAA